MATQNKKSNVGGNDLPSGVDGEEKSNKNNPKNKKNNKKSKDNLSVFKSIAGLCPKLGLPYQDYNLDTVTHNNLEGTTYTVRDLVEGKVDDNHGHTI